MEKAKEVHALVLWAVTERTRAMARGWSKANPQAMNTLMQPLKEWTGHYRVPQRDTLLRFWAAYKRHVTHVMPYNPAGKAKLERLYALMATI